MSPVALPQTGAYPLTGVGGLPNVDVASPGEVWSNRRANGIIVPGACIHSQNVGGQLYDKVVLAGDTIVATGDGIRKEDIGVALRQIMVPDVNPGSQYNPQLGPNEIMNLSIADTDYLRKYMTGVLNLTLVKPDAAYVPGDIIGWDPTATPPVGKAGTGAWARHASDSSVVANTDIFIVHMPARYYGTANECVLTVKFLRGSQ